MANGFEHRTALVTGAAAKPIGFPYAGLGETVARKLANLGCRVVLVDIDADRGLRLERDLNSSGAEATFIRADVSDHESVRAVARQALERWGSIDLLFHAAGIHSLAGNGTGSSFPNIDPADWDLMMDVHLRGTVNVVQEVARSSMIPNRRGRIVVVASLNAHGNWPATAYGVAKAAISYFMRGAAAGLGPHGITVNAVSPGMFASPIYRDFELADPANHHAWEQLMVGGRVLDYPAVATADEIADAAIFLLSDAARYVTGVDLNVSAGQVLYT